MKFKVGDKVKLNTSDRNAYTGFLSDLQLNLEDGTITGVNYDATVDAIEEGKAFTVTAVDAENECYELKIGEHELSFAPDERDLLPVEEKPTVSEEPINEQKPDSVARAAIREICEYAGKTLERACLRVLANLTDEEIDTFSTKRTQHMRLAKIILCACADEIDQQYNAEAIKNNVRYVKRLRRSRYC